MQDEPLHTKGNDMRRKAQIDKDELRSEYKIDYSKAVRGKYYRRLLKEGANVVVLEPDVAKAFRGSAEVNDASRPSRGCPFVQAADPARNKERALACCRLMPL